MKKRFNKLPNIRKDIKGFLLSEEGKIDKKNLVKIGLSLMILKMMFEPGSAQAQTHASSLAHSSGTASHSSSFTGTGHRSSAPHYDTYTHTSGLVPHSSNHDSGGWC